MTTAAQPTPAQPKSWLRVRIALWLTIYIVVAVIAGYLDTNFARSRDRMICRSGDWVALILETDAGLIVVADDAVPLEDAWGTVVWRREDRVLTGLRFDCYRIDSCNVYVRPYRRQTPATTSASISEIEAIRMPLAAYLAIEQGYPVPFASLFLEPDFDNSGPIWEGQIGNGVIYSTILTPLLYGLWRFHLLNQMQKRRRNLRRGQWPRCRYQIQGLPEDRCPECGETQSSSDVVGREEGLP